MITNHVIESFLECPYKAYLLFNNEQGKLTDYERLEGELSDLCRTDFYAQLHAKYDESQMMRGVTFEKKLAITDTIVVIEPVFQAEDVRIRFDALEISPHTELSSKLVSLPITVIPNEKVTKTDKLALAVKCLLLTQAQRRVTPEFGKIVYGRNLNSTKVKVEVYAKEARKVLKDLKHTLQSSDPPRYFQINDCRTCQFQKTCHAKLIEKDDLSLLAGMNPKDVLKQNNRGIFTVLQFSYTFRPRRRSKKATDKPLRFEPALKALALREKKTYIQELPKLPQTDVEVYFDFEGLPDENFIYLIGLIIKQGDAERQYSFWADTHEDEEEIFAQLFETLAPFENFTVYHYGSYETHALKRLNRKYENHYEEEVAWIIEKSVNILSFFSSTIYPPTYTNELKEIARFLGFRWSEQDASGIQSIVWRRRWELSGEAEYKKKLVQYNVEDCLAMKVLKEWLLNIGEQFENDDSKNFAKVENVRIERFFKWGATNYKNPDFEAINKLAYFDYQRSKIYLKVNDKIEKAVKKERISRKRENKVNKIIKILPERCPFCNYKQLSIQKKRSKVLIDLKFMNGGIKKWIIKFESGNFQCCRCKEIFTPKEKKELFEYRGTPYKYGKNLLSWAIHNYVTYRMSFEKIANMLLESYSIQVSRYSIRNFRLIVSREYEVTFEEIRQIVINGPLIHVDETSANVQKFSGGYVWVFTSMDAVFYMFRSTREADFLQELLKNFRGILESDFYAAYDSLPCLQQKCLVHLIRDLNDALHLNQLNTELKNIVVNFGKLLRGIVETIDKYGLKKSHLKKHSRDVEKFYQNCIEQNYESEIAVKYQKKFQKYQDKLFTFLNYDGIPWNNNNAEHAIKPFAKYRREVEGRFTENSINSYLILLTIQQTCQYRGLSFLEFLKSGETSIEAYTRKVLG